ncbi:hypothetical protein HUT16_29100 [Kitasatospora sp. NA04385]|uniref:hypothetical protein n=1 Tax=Kitasatospora sp. NA04385 TaxID=2742135 RepID=UPI001591FBC6|nr:hypothetical protein [Kitasatospora sp. NA04385]QKW22603.1 hypothetical protein HUT16_29100 [Kitasatospora sp. NA04385]
MNRPPVYAFFRAPGPDAVRAAFTAGPALRDPAAAFDALRPADTDPDADPGDLLELLDELVLTLPDAELVEHTVRPATGRPSCFVLPDDPWSTGPWAHQLSPAVRDLLADSPAESLRALRPQGRAPAAPALAALPGLAALARRAAAADERLYYWLDDPMLPD